MQNNSDPKPAKPRYPHLGAFESTKLMNSDTDILGTTRHIECWQADLQMLYEASMLNLRYSVPWHRIEKRRGFYNFKWFDGPMQFMEKNKMDPILDPLHHISFPDWLDQGFANPHFPELYTKFVTAIAQRYPWVNRYTVVNEPLPTTLFCSYTGGWYPHQASDNHFVRMAVNMARAICLASAAIRSVNPAAQFIHIDTAEVHRALDRKAEDWVRFASQRRFLLHDLVLGRVNDEHELWPYLHQHGMSLEDRDWLLDNGTCFDVLGLDYYMHSEMEWLWDDEHKQSRLSWPVQYPIGFAEVAQDYIVRYKLPVMLSETNLRGTYLDRLTWLKFMEEQSERVAESTDFRGFCWYPSIDSTDWCHFCTKATGTVDPQGIWCLDTHRWRRHASELSDYYVRLAEGSIDSTALPAYTFSGESANSLQGYEKLMSHWPNRRDQGILLLAS